MHNAETCVGSSLIIIWDLLERSVSLPVRITLMEVIISTCSRCGNGSFDADDPMFLMSEVATQTLTAISGLQDRLTTTSSRMGTLSQVRSSGRAEAELCRLAMRGVQSSIATLKTSFGVVFGSWLQRNFAATIQHYGDMRISNSLRLTSLTSPGIAGTNLHLEQFLAWMHGPQQIWTLREVGVPHNFISWLVRSPLGNVLLFIPGSQLRCARLNPLR